MDSTLSQAATGPLTDRLLDGRYEVGRLLARGGMATVYEAVDTRLERPVAIKVMHPAFASDPDFVARFIREARSAARLSHSNVVAVYDQGSDGDTVFLAMEFVSGGTLRDLLRDRGRLTPDEALPLYEQMLAALAAAHRAGLVHRDVKPENVLISSEGRVKVADFGLARAVASSISSAATTGVIIGTVSYLSPEQVERSVADARSDVYSAGIVLYELLTGVKPYRGDTPMEIAFQHVHSRVPAPSRLVPDLPVALDTIVARATARDPDLRPHDAGDLLAEVVRAREGRPLLLPPLPDQSLASPTLDDQSLDAAERTVRRDEVHDTLVVGRPRRAIPSDEPAIGPAIHQLSDAPPDTVPAPDRRRRRRGWLVFLVVLLLGLGAGVGTYWYVEGRFTTTPAVLELPEADAIAAVERFGLSAAVAPDGEFSETVPVDSVVRTDPAAGERILTGGEVTLVLSAGPERFTLPDVAGSTPAEAVAALESDTMPLTVAPEHKEEYSETVAAGSVTRTEPAEDAVVERDQTITLVLSLGREPVPVPAVSGKTLEEATAELEKAGFTVTSEELFSSDVDSGLIIAQDKTGELFRGDAVHLQVSKGPELFPVPSVIGDDTDDAEQALLDAGFTVDVIRVLPEALTDDIVIRQTPGGDQPAGTLIKLYVI